MTPASDGRPAPDGRAAADGTSAPRRPLRIGVTGPIGCGKSTVGRWLEAAGAVVVDADALARDVTAPGTPALAAIVARFGDRYLREDGSLDRRALGRLVFADPAALADLETIVHPVVRPRILAAFAEAGRRGQPSVVEAIKLVEGGLAAECDEVWLVDCDAAAQVARLRNRGMSGGDARRRIAAQAGLAERLRPRSTRVIDTSGTPEATERAVLEAFRAALAAHEARSVGR